MSPAERILWLAKHHAPPNMRLITDLELHVVTQGLNGERRARLAQQAETNAATSVLDSYWTTEPDLENACASAVFDANRYRIATTRAIPLLKQIAEALRVAAEHDSEAVRRIDWLKLWNAAKTEIDFIENIIAQRRERKKPDAPNTSHSR